MLSQKKTIKGKLKRKKGGGGVWRYKKGSRHCGRKERSFYRKDGKTTSKRNNQSRIGGGGESGINGGKISVANALFKLGRDGRKKTTHR